jgi:hypothetical protein
VIPVPVLRLENTQGGCIAFRQNIAKNIPINSTILTRFIRDDGSILEASSLSSGLQYVITKNPDYGRLYYTVTGTRGVCLSATGVDCPTRPATVTVASCPTGVICKNVLYGDVRNFKYEYNGGAEFENDIFRIKALYKDSTGTVYESEELEIRMCIEATTSPPTATYNTLYLWECGNAVINNNTNNQDIDSNINRHIKSNNPNVGSLSTAGVFFEVNSLPQPSVGRLTWFGNILTNTDILSQDGIDGGNLRYEHVCDPENPLPADLTIKFRVTPFITATNGNRIRGVQNDVTIIVKRVIEPTVVKNGPLVIETQSSIDRGCIDKRLLWSITQGKNATSMRFSIKTLPQYGTLMFSNSGTSPTTNTSGFTPVVTNTEYNMTILDNPCSLLFVIDDSINSNRDPAISRWDTSFDWDAWDVDTNKHISGSSATFPIRINKRPNARPVVALKTLTIKCDNTSRSRAFNDPSDTDKTVIITDTDSPNMDQPELYRVKIIELPLQGSLNVRGVEQQTNNEFTYRDILSGSDVIYQHNGGTILSDSIKLQVVDGDQTVNFTVNVTVENCIREPIVTTDCIEVLLPTELAQRAVIPQTRNNRDIFIIRDNNNSPVDKFQILITQLPRNGGSLFNGDTQLQVGQWVPYRDIVDGRFTYLARQNLSSTNPADRSVTRDDWSFKVKNTDGLVEYGPFTHCIMLTWEALATPPYRDVSQCLGLELPREAGRDHYINENTLTIKSALDSMKSGPFYIKIQTLPQWGILKVGGIQVNAVTDTWIKYQRWEGNTFRPETQITYTTINNIPLDTIRDSFKFIIRDDLSSENNNNGEGFEYCIMFRWPTAAVVVDIRCLEVSLPSEVGIEKNIDGIEISSSDSSPQTFEIKINRLPTEGQLRINGALANNTTWYEWPITATYTVTRETLLRPREAFTFNARIRGSTVIPTETYRFCINPTLEPETEGPTVRQQCLEVANGADTTVVHRLTTDLLEVFVAPKEDPQPEFEIQITELPKGILEIGGTIVSVSNVTERTWFPFPDPTTITYRTNNTLTNLDISDPFRFRVRIKTPGGNGKTNPELVGESLSFCININWPTPPSLPYRDVDSCMDVAMPEGMTVDNFIDSRTLTIKSDMPIAVGGPFHIRVMELPIHGVLYVDGAPLSDTNSWIEYQSWSPTGVFQPSRIISYRANPDTLRSVTSDEFKFIIMYDINSVNENDGEYFRYCINLNWSEPGIEVNIACLDIELPADIGIEKNIDSITIQSPDDVNAEFEIKVESLPLVGVIKINNEIPNTTTWYTWPANITYTPAEGNITAPESIFTFKVRLIGTTDIPDTIYRFCINVIPTPEDVSPPEQYIVGTQCIEIALPDMVFTPYSWIIGEHVTVNTLYNIADLSFGFAPVEGNGNIATGDFTYNGSVILKNNSLVVELSNLNNLIYRSNVNLNNNHTLSHEYFNIFVSHVDFPDVIQEATLCVSFSRTSPPSDLEDVEPPEIINNGLYTACSGATTIISTTNLNVFYDNTLYNDSSFIFSISSIPTNGQILLNGTPLSIGGSFTLADIRANIIRYRNITTTATNDEFTFEMQYLDNNGALTIIQDVVFRIGIIICFRIVRSGPLVITGAEREFYIDETLLLAEDSLIAASDIRFTITNTSGLNCGRLRFGAQNNTGIANMSQQQVTQQLFTYVLNTNCDGNAINDEFQYSVTNSSIVLTGTFLIQRAAEAPLIEEVNTGLTLYEGTCRTIDSTMLRYSKENFSSTEIIYNIVAGQNVRNGTLTVRGAPATSFTQRDLNDGDVVRYCHTNTNIFSDLFRFTVTAGTTTTAVRTFSINVIEIITTQLINNGMRLGACRTKVLTLEMLNVMEPPSGVSDTQITFTVTSVPNWPTEPIRVMRNGILMQPGDVFTKRDIQDGIITVEHRSLQLGNFRFGFTWQAGSVIGLQTEFNIEIFRAPLPAWMSRLNMFTLDEQSDHVVNNQDILASDYWYGV